MRIVLLGIVGCAFLLSSNGVTAQVTLHHDCRQYQETVTSSFVLFSQRELMELGACTGVALLKDHRLSALPEACNEVKESKSVFGIATLSKAEAIKVGQCAGVINYIYERYNNERITNYSGYKRRNQVYSCIRGDEAVNILSKSGLSTSSRNDVRALLCDSYRG